MTTTALLEAEHVSFAYGGRRAIADVALAVDEGEMLAIDEFAPPLQNPIQYMLDCIERGRKVEGPLSLEISRTGQRIVDAAVMSAAERRTVVL